jgi:hypothetical protein
MGGTDQPMTAPTILTRSLAARATGLARLPGLIDAVTDGAGMRVFLGEGADPAAVAADPAVQEIRVIGRGLMLRAAPGPVALAGGGTLDAQATPAETDWLAGRRVILGFRLDETPAQVAQWVSWHATAHGADGFVIVNRTGPAPALAPALATALAALPLAVTVILVDCPLPLGHAGEGPETHPFLAPDAPGRDRMDRPAADPFRAALAEVTVYEALRWRFLAEARAVLALDPCDVLPPGPARPFDAAMAAPGGVVVLAGRRAYPWRLRPDRPAAIGDHICRMFDSQRGIARWGVAPARVPASQTWRHTRISHARPDPATAIPFWRCMALRVSAGAAGELAPKSALVEDDGLLALAAALGHRPVRPPRSAPRAAATDRTAIVTTMKNEGPFILEWLAWHQAIGVDDFLIYTNDCTDGTDSLLALLDARGIVQHRDNPYRAMDLKPQHAALQAAESEPVMQGCGWGICMDVDEFITIKLGDGRLPALYAAMEAAHPGANMISLTWRLFGNDGIDAYQDRFVTEQFTACAPELVRKPHQAWGFKTLFRNIDIYRKLGVHRPKGLRPDLWDRVRWLNGSGQPLPKAMFRNGWRSTADTYGYDWVQLNHYAVRSAESFLVKRDRGRANHIDRDQGLNYWFRMNFNAARDDSARRILPLAQAAFARLMADPAIAAAHHATVATHRAKIAELMARPEQAAFHAALISPRMQRLCRMQAHFGSAVFMAGPDAIPDAIAMADHPPGFAWTLTGQTQDA